MLISMIGLTTLKKLRINLELFKIKSISELLFKTVEKWDSKDVKFNDLLVLDATDLGGRTLEKTTGNTLSYN
jgi:hypothetical protein